MTRSVERILVRCPNWLGDVVMATPGLRALRAAYPEARIVAQLPEKLLPLLEGSGFQPLEWHAGFERGSPVDTETWHIVAVAQRPPSAGQGAGRP